MAYTLLFSETAAQGNESARDHEALDDNGKKVQYTAGFPTGSPAIEGYQETFSDAQVVAEVSEYRMA